jgi:hypothetical protein
MRADNSRHIVAAARNRHEYTRAKAVQALREIEAAGTPVTFEPSLARPRFGNDRTLLTGNQKSTPKSLRRSCRSNKADMAAAICVTTRPS